MSKSRNWKLDHHQAYGNYCSLQREAILSSRNHMSIKIRNYFGLDCSVKLKNNAKYKQ